MKFILLFFSILYFNLSMATEKLVVTGEVFDKTGKDKKFIYEKYHDTQGDKNIDRAIYKNLDNEILTEEKIETQNNQLIRYEIEQHQLKQKAWIEIKNSEVTFNLKKYRKKNYPQVILKPENFIVGLQIVPFIINHWDSLISGQEKEIKLGVWYRQEAITFKLSKSEAEKDKMTIKMSPTNFLIRAVVDPIYFTFEVKTKTLLEYKGRTTPKVKSGQDYLDFDGVTRYKIPAS
jgi:hypothetical protein